MKARRLDSPSCSKSRNGEEEENSVTIPLDLVIEILLRLPAKSTARFHCVSKLWSSTLASSEFKNSFSTISLSRPKLLLTCLKDGKTFFFTSHNPQDASPSLIVSGHMSFPINSSAQIYRSVRGLVCGLNQEKDGKNGRVSVPLICNPSTGQYLTLPGVLTMRMEVIIIYLGYVPIDKQFKVLMCMGHMAYPNGLLVYCDFQLLTLGTGEELSWQSIRCDIDHERFDYGRGRRSHPAQYNGVCINGILYYLAVRREANYLDVICFEFGSEKFMCIKHDQGMEEHMCNEGSTLVNYKGKLALVQPGLVDYMYSTELWVLEDAEKHVWSSSVYVYSVADSPPVKNVVGSKRSELRFVGMTDIGEIVWAPSNVDGFFYLLYFNTETKAYRRVEILGMEAFKDHKVCIFLDHVEDVKPMASVQAHELKLLHII